MIPVYVIALAIAGSSFLWFRQTSEDIYSILAAGTALFSLVLGFASAPWPVQVGIVLALTVLERLYIEQQRRRGLLSR
ncbi:MAG: hypothetical protein J7641_17145 [Cyanobacteria bacterium SID2]|nr:hypothetical protein [Cyanobacteria bacterium SID2]MBP0005043.1 hypothetical protein [Cyanobacteria bacterium SBC]